MLGATFADRADADMLGEASYRQSVNSPILRTGETSETETGEW